MGKVVDVNPRYCLSAPGLVKVVQLIFAAAVFCLILIKPFEEKESEPIFTPGEEFTIVTATFASFVTLLFLFLYFLGCHRAWCAGCKCHFTAYLFYSLAACMWFISAGVETWMTIRYLDWNRMVRFRMRASASAFCYAEGLLYLANLLFAKFYDL